MVYSTTTVTFRAKLTHRTHPTSTNLVVPQHVSPTSPVDSNQYNWNKEGCTKRTYSLRTTRQSAAPARSWMNVNWEQNKTTFRIRQITRDWHVFPEGNQVAPPFSTRARHKTLQAKRFRVISDEKIYIRSPGTTSNTQNIPPLEGWSQCSTRGILVARHCSTRDRHATP